MFNNIIKSKVYYLTRNSFVQLLIIICFVSIVFSLFFLRVDDGQLFIIILSEQLSNLIINGLASFIVPLYLFIYLFTCILAVENQHNIQEVSSLLTGNVTRIQQYVSFLYIFFLYSIIISFLLCLVYYMLYRFSLFLFVYSVLIHMAIFSQVQFLFSLRISKNTILFIYLLFFVFIPVFYQEILKVVLIKINNSIITTVIELYFTLTSAHYDIIRNIGKSIGGMAAASDVSTYVLYVIILNTFAVFLFAKKQFS